jgi:histone deacetylase 6
MKTERRANLTILSDNCTEQDSIVECLIAFVAETALQSIRRATDDTIAHWYHAVSHTFISTHYHPQLTNPP